MCMGPVGEGAYLTLTERAYDTFLKREKLPMKEVVVRSIMSLFNFNKRFKSRVEDFDFLSYFRSLSAEIIDSNAADRKK